MANNIVKQDVLSVSYEVAGQQINIDSDFVKKYLVRGKSELVTDQEILFYLNLCKMQKLNPLTGSESYIIKFSTSEPAQMVVGKSAYMRRAYENPDYLCKEDGIIVQRCGDIVQKEGCCLYPGEILIGGWCRVHYLRNNVERTAYKEVSLSEYDKGQANWKSKPATMLTKVAISQCVREAFPKQYEGLYSEDEMVASGAVPAEYVDVTNVPKESVLASNKPPVQTISKEQRTAMILYLQNHFGDGAVDVLKDVCMSRGINSPDKILAGDYAYIMTELEARSAAMQEAEVQDDGFADEVVPDAE